MDNRTALLSGAASNGFRIPSTADDEATERRIMRARSSGSRRYGFVSITRAMPSILPGSRCGDLLRPVAGQRQPGIGLVGRIQSLPLGRDPGRQTIRLCDREVADRPPARN